MNNIYNIFKQFCIFNYTQITTYTNKKLFKNDNLLFSVKTMIYKREHHNFIIYFMCRKVHNYKTNH